MFLMFVKWLGVLMLNSSDLPGRVELSDAFCRVSQAQVVLAMWLELVSDYGDKDDINHIGSIITILDGVPEAIKVAEIKLADYSRIEMGLKPKK